MKKILFMGLILISSLISYAQKIDSLKNRVEIKIDSTHNELKFNVLYAARGMPELSYERLIADNMGFGISFFVGLDNAIIYKFGLNPYYRLYFGKQKANGFFIEGNTGIMTIEDDFWQANLNRSIKVTTTSPTLGIAVGFKLLSRYNFFADGFVRYGKLIANRIGYNTQDFSGIGLSIGKRF